MSDAILALRAAIQTRLAADADLTALIGAGRVHDEAPRAASGVYVVHGEVDARDWSTGSDKGCEQDVLLIGHRLVNLRGQSSRLARESRTGLASVTIRLRAVTETL
jgi:hypothetical protein